jgi:hypothetical protein
VSPIRLVRVELSATKTHELDATILNNAVATTLVAVSGFEVSFMESQARLSDGKLFRANATLLNAV